VTYFSSISLLNLRGRSGKVCKLFQPTLFDRLENLLRYTHDHTKLERDDDEEEEERKRKRKRKVYLFRSHILIRQHREEER